MATEYLSGDSDELARKPRRAPNNTFLYAVLATTAISAILIGLKLAGAGAGRPARYSKKWQYSFPIVPCGTLVSHVFRVVNHSRSVMSFRPLWVSCSCTYGRVFPQELPPGGSGRLRLSVQLPESPADDLTKAVLSGISDGHTYTFEYLLQSRCGGALAFALHPEFWNFGKMAIGSPTRIIPAVLVQRGSLPIQFDRITVRSDVSDITAAINGNRDGKSWQLSLSCRPRRFVGTIAARLIFHFWRNGRELKYCQTRWAIAQVVGPVYAAPASVLFGIIKRGTMATSQIRIISRSNRPVQILGATVHAAGVNEVTVAVTDPATIAARLIAGHGVGPVRGDIFVHVRESGTYWLKLPYLARIVNHLRKPLPQ